MGCELKSKLIKEMKNDMNQLRRFIKKIASNHSFKAENDLEKTFDFFKDDKRLLDQFDHFRFVHYFYFFEIKNSSLSFSLDFPYNYEDYEDLKEKTTMYVSIKSNFEHDSKNNETKGMNYNVFKKNIVDFLWVFDFFEEHNVYDQPNKSIKTFMINQFKEAWFEDTDKFEKYIKYIKENSFIILEVLKTKNAYIEKRKELNKNQKAEKKKNNSVKKQKMSENEKEIRTLQRRINALKKENENMKNKQYNPDSELKEKECLQYNYKITLDLFWKEHGYEIRKSPFYDSFELMLLSK